VRARRPRQRRPARREHGPSRRRLSRPLRSGRPRWLPSGRWWRRRTVPRPTPTSPSPPRSRAARRPPKPMRLSAGGPALSPLLRRAGWAGRRHTAHPVSAQLLRPIPRFRRGGARCGTWLGLGLALGLGFLRAGARCGAP
jgi:hypothetical protein